MKYYKEFKEAHPETVGEKEYAFDMSNYIDWIDGKYSESKLKNNGDIEPVINWQSCNYITGKGMPTDYGKYLICRKDGKIHWETFNGSGWAYNGNSIRYWAIIADPCR